MNKILSKMCMVLMLMVSIYSLALADAGIENLAGSFKIEEKNKNGRVLKIVNKGRM